MPHLKIIRIILFIIIFYGEVLGDKIAMYTRVIILRVADCIVTISFGVYLVLWLF